MTRRRGPLSRLVLPSEVNPSTTVCFSVPVPNDPQHIAAFKGAIYRLSKPYTWADDDAHTALDVAAVWRTIFDNLGNCEMTRIRLKPTDFCMLQLSTDGGETWEDVADLSNCAHAAAVDEIQDAIDRGQIPTGGTPPLEGGGISGECYEYDVTLKAGDRWYSPVAVEGDDSVEISNVRGGWTDGDWVHGAWFCGDGNTYLLGACLSSGADVQSTDPAPNFYHMRLIGAYATTPHYFDAYNTIYNIPSGQAETYLTLMANDSVLYDNAGQISFHVKICKDNPPSWPTTEYCTVMSEFPLRGKVYAGEFASGGRTSAQRLQSNDAAVGAWPNTSQYTNFRYCAIQYDFDEDKTITSCGAYWHRGQGTGSNWWAEYYDVDGTVLYHHDAGSGSGGPDWYTHNYFPRGTPLAGVRKVIISFGVEGLATGNHGAQLSDVELCYEGD